MDAKEFYKYSSWCFANNVKIYPVPVSNAGIYRIAVATGNRETIGEGTYKDKPMKDHPGVWDKIRELYKQIYEKNHREKPIEP